jgi:iron complex outermembrane receptor protein
LLNNLTAADGSATEIITKSVFLIDQIAMWENRVHFLLGARYDDLGKANGGTNTTPQVGVTYTVHPGVNVYATFSESYVPNPPEVLNGHFPNVVSYFPADTGKGYEAGVKFDLDNSKLSATAAFFSVTRSNVLETEANAADALVTDAILSGEQKSDGVELDVTGQVTPEYSIVASYSHTLARITKDDVSPDQVGLRLEGVAPNQAALWNNYRFAPGPLKGWSAGAGLLWREGPIQHLVIRAGEAINQGTYTTVEAALAYEFKSFGHEWRLALNVHNLTDADYFDRRSQKALPRDFLVSVSTKF